MRDGNGRRSPASRSACWYLGIALSSMVAAGCNCGTDSKGDAGIGHDGGGACVKVVNKALHFSGAQHAVALDSPSLRLSDLTVEAWVSFGGLSSQGYNTVIAKPFGTTTADSFTVWYQFGGLYAGANPINPSTAIGGAWSPTLGHWYHLAFTYEDATRAERLYVDGALFASGTAGSSPVYDEHPFYIGGDSDFGSPSGYFIGDIDEVRIWTSVRAIEEVGTDLRSCASGAVPGLAAYFSFDEGVGQTAGDLSGNGNTAQLGATANVDSVDPSWVDSGVPYD